MKAIAALASVIAAASVAAGVFEPDAERAFERARAENKAVMLVFTSGDTCLWCRRFRAEVFDDDRFAARAARDFVPVWVEFFDDAASEDPVELEKKHALADRYRVESFPVAVLCDASGRELCREKYREGGAAAFLERMGAALRPAWREIERKIASKYEILVSDEWGGGHRLIFKFEGRKAWLVVPEKPREDRRWIWTTQWMGAYLERTGAPLATAEGFFHAHLEAFDTRASDEGLAAMKRYRDYLVDELSLAPKAGLIGMSWGGFYAVRYAAAYPQSVNAVYLDNPLLVFPAGSATSLDIGPWAKDPPPSWDDDPRMPINEAPLLARSGIPVYLLYGGQDKTLDPKANAEEFLARYRAAGGSIKVERRAMYGHHPHGFEHGKERQILEFFSR